MKGWNIRTIILGYDASEGGECAAQLATALAQVEQSRIVVLTSFPHGYNPVDPGEQARAAQVLVDRLMAENIEAELDIVQNDADKALLVAADARKADLIVVGRRGRNRAARLLLGSTSEAVIRRATVPVLVAQEPPTGREGKDVPGGNAR